MDYETYRLGDLATERGGVLEDAFIGYRTWGTLNPARDNCIVVPSYYTGTHRSYEPMIGPGRALDPEHYFIVLPNAFGNGVSSSPSNTSGAFPVMSVADNVKAQRRLLFDHLGVRRVALATGWSMGAMQAYGWASLYPDDVERLLPWCGAAHCWPLNQVFLEGLVSIMDADPSPDRKAGLRAFGRSYAGWAYSAQFYRDGLYRSLGFDSLAAFLMDWEEDHVAWAADDLLTQLYTWRGAEPGAEPEAYLGRIRARTVVMPCDRDVYFTLAEAQLEASMIGGAALEVIRSPFGHCAGSPGKDPASTAQVEAAMKALLKA